MAFLSEGTLEGDLESLLQDGKKDQPQTVVIKRQLQTWAPYRCQAWCKTEPET